MRRLFGRVSVAGLRMHEWRRARNFVRVVAVRNERRPV